MATGPRAETGLCPGDHALLSDEDAEVNRLPELPSEVARARTEPGRATSRVVPRRRAGCGRLCRRLSGGGGRAGGGGRGPSATPRKGSHITRLSSKKTRRAQHGPCERREQRVCPRLTSTTENRASPTVTERSTLHRKADGAVRGAARRSRAWCRPTFPPRPNTTGRTVANTLPTTARAPRSQADPQGRKRKKRCTYRSIHDPPSSDGAGTGAGPEVRAPARCAHVLGPTLSLRGQVTSWRPEVS